MSNERRRVVHFHLTDSPTANRFGQQMSEVFSWDTAPRFVVRDRDGIYGDVIVKRVGSMGIEEIVVAVRIPCKNPYLERLTGSI